MSFLEIKQLTKHYNTRTVVSAVDLEMNQGEILSLLGPSGCGKTTILRMIAGLITPDGGYIRVNDRVFYDNGRQLPTEERQLGMVFSGSGALAAHDHRPEYRLWSATAASTGACNC